MGKMPPIIRHTFVCLARKNMPDILVLAGYILCITVNYLELKSIPNEAAALATYLLVCIHPALSSSALVWSSSASQAANKFSGVCWSGDR